MTYERPCIRPTDTAISTAGCCPPQQSFIEFRLGNVSYKVFIGGDCNGNIISS